MAYDRSNLHANEQIVVDEHPHWIMLMWSVVWVVLAIQFGTTIVGTAGGGRLRMRSDRLDGVLDVPMPVTDPGSVQPSWGRYPAGVAALLGRTDGFDGEIVSDLPIGGGLSSSASLEVATALALGATGSPLDIARLCRAAEAAATGVPCGIMDQLAVAAGVEGHALLIDCATEEVTPVPVPSAAAIWVVDSGQVRTLADSAYAERRAQADAAAALVGPLPRASMASIASVADPVLRARARHVRTECDRVHAAAAALVAGDLVRVGLGGEAVAGLEDLRGYPRAEAVEAGEVGVRSSVVHGAMFAVAVPVVHRVLLPTL